MTESVKPELGQKQETSLLDLQEVLLSQVLRQRGRRDGAGAFGGGDWFGGGELVLSVVGGMAVHLVQTVAVDVMTTVEIVFVVEMIVELPEVEVMVTGQVVRVV